MKCPGLSEVKFFDSWEPDVDLSRRQRLTGLVVNLLYLIVMFVGSYVLKWLTPGPTGVAMAAVLGFATVCGIPAWLAIRHFTRRRDRGRGVSPPSTSVGIVLATVVGLAALALPSVTSASEPDRRVVALFWQSIESPESVGLTWQLEPLYLGAAPEDDELFELEFLDYDQDYRLAQVRLLCPAPEWVSDDARATPVLSIWQSVEEPETLLFSWGDGELKRLVFADWPGPYRLAPSYDGPACPGDWGEPPRGGHGQRVLVDVLIWQDIDEPESLFLGWGLAPIEVPESMPESAFPLTGLPEDEGPYLQYAFRLLCDAPPHIAEEDRTVGPFMVWLNPDETEGWRTIAWISTDGSGVREDAIAFDLLLLGPDVEHRVGRLGVEITCPSSWPPPATQGEPATTPSTSAGEAGPPDTGTGLVTGARSAPAAILGVTALTIVLGGYTFARRRWFRRSTTQPKGSLGIPS